MKCSTIYFFNDTFYIHTDCKTTAGVWVLYPPVFKVSKNDKAEVGKRVLDSLRASNDNVAHPTDFKVLIAPLLDSTQVKSWDAFAKTALCLSVEEKDDLITLIPNQYFGKEGGYVVIPGKSRSLITTSTNELGEAVFFSIKECK